MPRRINNIRWQRVLTDRTRGGGESEQGFAGVCNLGNGQLGAIFGEHIESAFNGTFFTLAPAKWKHRFYMSDDGGFNWRLASEIPTDGDSGINFGGSMKSGMLGFRPGGALHGQCGGAINFTSFIFNRPGGIYRMRQNDGKWERVFTPSPIAGGVDFHIFCDWAKMTADGGTIIACGEFDSITAVGPGPIFDLGSLFFFLRSTSSGQLGSWQQYGGNDEDLPVALKESQFNVDGIITMLMCKDTGLLLAGAHMTQRSPRGWWNNRGGRAGSWREIHFPGNYDQFNTEQYCNTFINFGNGIIVAGGGAPTGKFPVSNSTYPDGIPFATYAREHGYTIVNNGLFNLVFDANGNPDNGYWHYPLLWRTTTGPGGTWEERSLTIGQFAQRTAIPGGQPGAVGDVDGEWMTRCGVGLGGGTGCLGLTAFLGPNGSGGGYTTRESPFWFTNDYGESFPLSGEFNHDPYVTWITQQMTVTNDGNILAGAYVESVTDPIDPTISRGYGQGELWLGIVEATEYYSVGFMERPVDASFTGGDGLRPDLETTRG